MEKYLSFTGLRIHNSIIRNKRRVLAWINFIRNPESDYKQLGKMPFDY